MKFIKLFLKGIVLGIANVIPGVSGGTMAVVFNVYDKIIELITPNIKKILRAWKFWFPLVIGMGVGIIAFSKIITKLLESYPIPTTYFFIGLILGSVPLIVRKMKETKSGNFNFKHILAFALGLLLVLSMIIFGENSEDAKETAKLSVSLENMTIIHGIMLFVAGAAAAVAMIIPGISGSFLLLALGMYGTIMAAISKLAIIFLIPFAFGVLAGLIFGAALVRLLMKKIPSYTYAAILGLIVGSVVVIFPSLGSISTMLISLVMTLFGFSTAYLSSKGEY